MLPSCFLILAPKFTLKQEISDGVCHYLAHWSANLDPVCIPGEKKYMKWLYITVNVSEIKWMLNQSNATAMLQSIFLYAIFV